MNWREITGSSKQRKRTHRFKTQYYAACLCEYVPILSMQTVMIKEIETPYTFCAITFDPELRSSPNFDSTQPRPYTTSIGGATITCRDADGTPWWPKMTLECSKHIPKAPGSTVSKFHQNRPSGYEDTLHDSSLRDCYLQWPQYTLLAHLQPCRHWIQQTQLQLSQLQLQNSYRTNHRYRS